MPEFIRLVILAAYLDGRNKFLGMFINEEHAAKAYRMALTERGIKNRYAQAA
mgnify:CR=1 FL=1